MADMHTFTIPAPDRIRILPMTDHYAVTSDGEIVAVVTKTIDGNWQVRTVVGRVPDPCSYIPLEHALQAAMKWKRC